MPQDENIVVIPKEKSVFWLDSNGWWKNAGGRFRKKKIIDYFHKHIGLDENGYFVLHDKGGVWEKVYFPYEDTALFVFDILNENNGNDIRLVLNTGQNILLDPEKLHINDDQLYTIVDHQRIRFAERAMIKMSKLLEEDKDGRLVICTGGVKYTIAESGVNEA